MSPQIITIIIAILTALSRILPATKPLWSRLGQYRILPPIVLVAVGYVLQGLTGGDWLSDLELTIGAIVALLAPGLSDVDGR